MSPDGHDQTILNAPALPQSGPFGAPRLTKTLRESAEAELKAVVVPQFREMGFRGSFPHLRRLGPLGVDLLTFQFDRNGGGFVIEIARGPATGFQTHWGEMIPPAKLTAWDLHPDDRHRIKPRDGGGTDSWFRYDDGSFKSCSQAVLAAIPMVEIWFAGKGSISDDEDA